MENGVEVKKTRSGLIVRLRDGCIISWDGASIQHCTSIRIDPKNQEKPFEIPQYGYFPIKSDIYSFHYVNSLATLKDMKEGRDNEYSHHMGDALGPTNWDMFDRLKYPEDEYYW